MKSAMDHCRGIDAVYHQGKAGEVYNIGSKNEIEGIMIARLICEKMDALRGKMGGSSYGDQIEFIKDRPGHDFQYAIDCTKIESELGWEPNENFESGLDKTLKYYLERFS